jgi:predicted deacetylase
LLSLVHVTLHDVSPVFAEAVEAALGLCARFGAKPALLVVPNYHGNCPLAAHPNFAARLRELADSGHEIYLHGLVHQARTGPRDAARDGRPGPLRRLFAQRIVSAGEAEFSDLGRAEAAERLDEGIRMLARAGLTPEGFVPPAWSMPSWVRKLLAERGFRHTEDHLRVYDPVLGTSRPTVLINWATRSRARLWSTVAFGRLAWRVAPRMPLRIAVHPHDLGHPRVRHEIALLLGRTQGRFAARAVDLWSRGESGL